MEARRSLGNRSADATLHYRIGRIFGQPYLRKLHQGAQILALSFIPNCHRRSLFVETTTSEVIRSNSPREIEWVQLKCIGI
ncbi:MAG TPA: hypothetical protein DCO65_04750 [Spartobacteria bacterium]|nr:hypothetical protein [Spartobacteria bacterium]